MEIPFQRDIRNKNPNSYHQLVSLIQNRIQTHDTIENRRKVKQRQGLKGKALTHALKLLKHQYPCLTDYNGKVYSISSAPSKVTCEAPLALENQKVKFYKVHYSRDHETDECFEVVRMATLWSQWEGVSEVGSLHTKCQRARSWSQTKIGRFVASIDKQFTLPTLVGKIHTIIGGPHIGGETVSVQKNYTRTVSSLHWQAFGFKVICNLHLF